MTWCKLLLYSAGLQKGGKIQASLGNVMYRKWAHKFSEGNVYEINFFIVIAAKGSYRATNHAYRILFSGKTKVFPCDCNVIPNWGLSLKMSTEVSSSDAETVYLCGIIGLINVVSPVRVCKKGVVDLKIMVIQILDEIGQVPIVLLGQSAGIVSEYLSNHPNEKPVVVVQYAKLIEFQGHKLLQTLIPVSQIFLNPDIEEVTMFRTRFCGNVSHYGGPILESFDADDCHARFYDFEIRYPNKDFHYVDCVPCFCFSVGEYQVTELEQDVLKCEEESCDGYLRECELFELTESHFVSVLWRQTFFENCCEGFPCEEFDGVEDVALYFEKEAVAGGI
ncbi:uncharacterized protein LOC130729559 isoform X2 [Lotus japonicus]|uniref:uncharacterized protein LOC130729559 isoform X2 n=1 Tax=Lotus japonicus TaxID=34305 RepID=UPI00258837DB|nr:uncharacterized protein LOC130729559 isoform X2 [Lotus japonicus]